MRKLVAAAFLALATAAAVGLPANASPSRPTNGSTPSNLLMTAKITKFRATASGVVADGTLTGKLRSGTSVARDSAPVSFAVVT